ncbi:MAG: zinc ribbon domain-containing protein [Xenococcus sp. (in: cyanobacteria)]
MKLLLNIPEYFREIYDNWNFRDARVTYAKQTKQFWVRLVFEYPDPPKLEYGDVQGIDRGLYHLCSTHDGKFFSSNKIRSAQRCYLYNRKQLQQKGTRSAKRRLKAMSGREKRFDRYLIDLSHCITKQLAQQQNVKTFVLQNLDSERIWNQREYIRLPKFEEFLEYKATALGKTVFFLDSRFNPDKCNLCKSRNTTISEGKVKCHSCKYIGISSQNRAINLRDEYLLNTCSFSFP